MKTGTCAPNSPACDGARATTCNAQGSGYTAGGESCGASTTCNNGECKAHVCTPSSKVCSAKNVITCATDGLSSTITATCTASQYCDAASPGCKAQVCSPGTASCEGNAVKTCNSEGSGTVTSECTTSQYCDSASATCKAQVCTPSAVTCDGNAVKTCNADGSASTNKACSGGSPFCVAGVCKPCEPNELRCNGQQPQKCGPSGDWANNGAACSGDKACDAEGSLVCSASPTVPGGVFNRVNDASSPATLSTFRLDRYEVTVARFRAFVTAALGGYRPASGAGKHTHLNAGKGLAIGAGFEAGWDTAWNTELALASLAAWTTELSCHAALATWTQTAGANESKPINCANWYQATAFCIWDGGFLPSDAEWNYAAAGGSEQRLYPWGPTAPGTDSSLSVHNCSYMGASSCGGTLVIAPSGSVAAGDGKWRHSDLSGNMAEWVKDYGLPKPCTDCASAIGSGSTARGGYFGSVLATDVATTSRPSAPPDLNNPSIGLRCARLP